MDNGLVESFWARGSKVSVVEVIQAALRRVRGTALAVPGLEEFRAQFRAECPQCQASGEPCNFHADAPVQHLDDKDNTHVWGEEF